MGAATSPQKGIHAALCPLSVHHGSMASREAWGRCRHQRPQLAGALGEVLLQM